MSSVRRRVSFFVILGLVAALLGLCTSIGVAWWLALREVQTYTFSHMFHANIAPEGQTYRSSFRFSDEFRPGYRSVRIEALDRPLNRSGALQIAGDLEQTDRTPRRNAPSAKTAQEPQRPLWFPWLAKPGPDENVAVLAARASGWPWLCMHSSRLQRAGESKESLSGVMKLRSPTSYSRWTELDRGLVPLRPIWPGLLADAAIFAGAWMLLAVAILALRRVSHRARRMRGHCPACGYDCRALAADAPCPECGDPRTGSPGR